MVCPKWKELTHVYSKTDDSGMDNATGNHPQSSGSDEEEDERKYNIVICTCFNT